MIRQWLQSVCCCREEIKDRVTLSAVFVRFLRQTWCSKTIETCRKYSPRKRCQRKNISRCRPTTATVCIYSFLINSVPRILL